MFAKWFAALTSRPSKSNATARPRLEALEDRCAPAAVGYGGFGFTPSAGGVYSPTTSGYYGAYPSSTPTTAGLGYASAQPTGYTGMNGFYPTLEVTASPFDSYYSAFQIFGSATGTAAGAGAAGVGAAAPGSAARPTLTQVEQVIGTLFTQAAQQNPTAAHNLAMSELTLALDSYVYLRGVSMGIDNTSLQANITATQNSIHQNPLEQTPLYAAMGSLIFDAAADIILNSQNSNS
jgi:hypothetical protein